MKAQKAVSVLATLSILSFAVACNDGGGGGSTSDRYAEGFAAGKAQGNSEGKTEGYNLGKADGYKEGYDKGYDDGDKDGYARAEAYFKTADYSKGFADGNKQGLGVGYTDGYVVGKKDGYDLGYSDGYDDGELDGYDLGYDAGYDDGYDAGADDGYEVGYDVGYDDGYDFGRYGLSVGKAPKLQGYADVLSAFHDGLIDYSAIKAPVQTRRGLVANGELLLSEVSMTNKDTLKKAAVVEQYLVVEMSKQVKAKFGLSAERSLKIAKAANHFRKFASSRALTSEDTNAYAKEIIGADFGKISKAYESSMKGEMSDLNSLLEVAAEKNGTTPEKMGEIVTKMFL